MIEESKLDFENETIPDLKLYEDTYQRDEAISVLKACQGLTLSQALSRLRGEAPAGYVSVEEIITQSERDQKTFVDANGNFASGYDEGMYEGMGRVIQRIRSLGVHHD